MKQLRFLAYYSDQNFASRNYWRVFSECISEYTWYKVGNLTKFFRGAHPLDEALWNLLDKDRGSPIRLSSIVEEIP